MALRWNSCTGDGRLAIDPTIDIVVDKGYSGTPEHSLEPTDGDPQFDAMPLDLYGMPYPMRSCSIGS